MTTFLKFIISIFFFSFFNACFADSPQADLSKLLNSVTTMQANFSQVIYDNRGKASQKSSGRMAMQRPGKFRWEVKKPISQLIIANHSRLWIYDPDLEQVSIRPLQQTTGNAPALLLSNDNIVLDKSYGVKRVEKNTAKWKDWSWFELSSRQNTNMFTSIRMGFRNGQIQQMRLIDHLGHTTVIVFENTKTNASVAEREFILKTPANVDVIDETKAKK